MLCGHIGIRGDSVLLGAGVHVTHGANKDIFECLVRCLILLPHLSVIDVNSSGGHNLDSSAGAHSVSTWVVWAEKGDGGQGVVAETVRGKILLRPSPRCKSTEASFWLSFRWMRLIFSYFRRPMISSMVGFVKDPKMSVLARLFGSRRGRGGVNGVNQFRNFNTNIL